MFENITACESCYQFTLPACPPSDSNIIISGGFTPDDEVKWFLQDKFEHVYSGDATVNADGQILIPVNAFPSDYFTEHSGEFIIWIKLNGYTLEMTLNRTAYECISLNFQKINSENPSYIIE